MAQQDQEPPRFSATISDDILPPKSEPPQTYQTIEGPDLKTVFANPDFRRANYFDKERYLATINKDFRDMDKEERFKFVRDAMVATPMRPAPRNAFERFGEAVNPAGQAIEDVFAGIGAKALEPGFRLADYVRTKVTGKPSALQNPDIRKYITPPSSIPGKIGALSEPLMELYAMPTISAAKLPKMLKTGEEVFRETLPSMAMRSAFEGAKMGSQAYLHGDDPTIATALGSAAPLVGNMIQRAAPSVGSAARWLYEKALDPTKEITKGETQKVVPELLTRRFWAATFPRLQEQSHESLDKAEQDLEKAYDLAFKEAEDTYLPSGRYRTVRTPGRGPGRGPAGPTIEIINDETESLPAIRQAGVGPFTGNVGPATGNVGAERPGDFGTAPGTTERIYSTVRAGIDLRPVLRALRGMMDEYTVGDIQPTKQADITYRQIKDQYDRIRSLGRFISLQDARKLRQILDHPIGEKGMFVLDPRWASLDRVQLKAANTLRAKINEDFPLVGAANKEYSLWRNTTHVLDATARKRTGQRGELIWHGLATGVGFAEALGRGVRDPWEVVRDMMLVNAGMAVGKSVGVQTLSGVQLRRLEQLMENRDVEGFIQMAGVLLRPKAEEKGPSQKEAAR